MTLISLGSQNECYNEVAVYYIARYVTIGLT